MATRNETSDVVPLGDRPEFPFIGESSSIQAAKEAIGALATLAEPAVIEGGTGTGKEVVARLLHARSARPGLYVGLNCASVPPHTAESEFFGHERGAFTGALELRKGCFEQAHRGVLVFDELQDLEMPLQAKLLRVLETRSVVRVGGDRSIPFDVRIIVCTQRPLRQLVREGRLREDLFYRLDVHTIRLAPLCERPEDVPLLLKHFSARHGPARGAAPLVFAPEALDRLVRYAWPGNVRELEKEVLRLFVACKGGRVEISHLSVDIREESRTEQSDDLDFKRRLALDALTRAGGVRKKAAELLRIGRSTFYRHLGVGASKNKVLR